MRNKNEKKHHDNKDDKNNTFTNTVLINKIIEDVVKEADDNENHSINYQAKKVVLIINELIDTSMQWHIFINRSRTLMGFASFSISSSSESAWVSINLETQWESTQ